MEDIHRVYMYAHLFNILLFINSISLIKKVDALLLLLLLVFYKWIYRLSSKLFFL
jgi:hypothetical protein